MSKNIPIFAELKCYGSKDLYGLQYYQPEIVFDTIKDIIVDVPDDLRYNEVFPTKEDAKEWCRRHEYTDYYIRERKEGEIEGIRVINGKGEIIADLTGK